MLVNQLWVKILYLFRCEVEFSSEICPRKTLYLCPSTNWTWSHLSVICQPAICTCSVPSIIQQPEISDTGKRLWTGHVGCSIVSPSNRLTSGSNGYLPWFVQIGTQTGTCRVPPQPQPALTSAGTRWTSETGKKGTQSLNQPWNHLREIFFFWQVWQQGGASRYPHLPNVQYGHMFCISNLINKAEYIHHPQAAGGVQIIPSSVMKLSQAHRSRQSLWSWLYIMTDIMLILCSSLKPADESHTWLYVSAQKYISNLIHWNHFRLFITPVLSGCLLILNKLNR